MKTILKVLVGIVIIQFFSLSASFAQFPDINSLGKIDSGQLDAKSTNKINPYLLTNTQNLNKLNTAQQSKAKAAYTNSTVRSLIQKNIEKEKETKDQIEQLSIIERMFNGELKQFGYEMFNKSSYSALKGTLSQNYRLNIGDSVKIYLWGDVIDYLTMSGQTTVQPVIDTVVDAEGNVFVPGVGAFFAAGNTISSLQEQIFSSLSTKYSNFDVRVTVNEPRDFPILVIGNVQNPGTVYVNTSTNLIDAINLAGGIIKIGSLRDIEYIDDFTKKKVTIDLYDLIQKGQYPKITFKEGDIILIKPIGKVIGIKEGVKRPAIYEFKKTENLKDIINIAGGLLPSVNPNNLEIESYNTNTGEKKIKDSNLSALVKLPPADGDLIIFRNLYDVAENIVTLKGNIKHPGNFEYKEGMRLSNVLKSKDELLTQTFTGQAIINRFSGEGKDITTLPVSLSDFFNNQVDPDLQPLDTIEILASTKMPTIEVAGEVVNPGVIPYQEGMSLKDVLGDITLKTIPEKLVAEITNNIENFDFFKSYPEESTNTPATLQPEEITDPLMNNSLFNQSNQTPEDVDLSMNVNVQEEFNPAKEYLKRNRVQSVYLYNLLTLNQAEKDIKLFPYDKVMIRPLTEKEVIKTVKILGYVNKPGIYQIKPGMRLRDVINEAGGPDGNAYLNGLFFLRTSVSNIQKDALKRSVLELQEEIALKLNAAQNLGGETFQIGDFIASQKQLLDIMKEKAKQEYGRIVIDIQDNDISSLSNNDNLEILDGDEIIIPAKPMYVIVVGEVYNQSAIAFYPEKPAQYYLDRVGGITKRANHKESFIIKANGSVNKPRKLASTILEPGDSIIVPKKIKVPINIRAILRDFTQIGANAASAVFILTKL